MTTRKPQNSILVLATLGVYFGLVLAGATPQVLAQAAMTREFDVRDEVEVKEDLDTKPDNPAEIDLSNEAVVIAVVKSVSTFLTRVEAATPIVSFVTTAPLSDPNASGEPASQAAFFPSFKNLIGIDNYPRAGLDLFGF